MDADIAAHITTGATAVYMLEWLKRTPWVSFITPETKTVNRVVSGLLAVVLALGIEWSYDPSVGGTITIPPLMMLGYSAWEAIKQFTAQQLLWDGVVEPTTRRKQKMETTA